MSSNEWRSFKIIEVGKVITGKTPPTKDADNFNGDYPFITPVDMNGQKYIRKTARSLSQKGREILRNFSLPDNAICISCIGSDLGKVVKTSTLSYTNQQINSIVCNEMFDSDFIYYALHNISPLIRSIGRNSTAVPIINKSDFSEFEILAPEDLNTQKKIGGILSSLDDKIENNLAANQTLEEIARTLFKEWFINFNYPNADGNLKHSVFGEIPENWSINGIGEICYVQNGYAFKSKDFQEKGEVGIIKIKNINGNVVDIKNTDFVDASVVSSLDEKFKIESGALLIAMTGAEVGKIGLVPLTEKNLWLNQRVGMFQEKIAYGNLFMYLLLSTDTYQTAIQNSALGSAQPNISASAIESIRAIIPPAELVEAFGKTVKPMFEKILDNLAENETLKNTRDSLLPKLMSGEIEVNG